MRHLAEPTSACEEIQMPADVSLARSLNGGEVGMARVLEQGLDFVTDC